MLTAEEMVVQIQIEEFVLDYRHRQLKQNLANAGTGNTAKIMAAADTLSINREKLGEVRRLMGDMQIKPFPEDEKQRRWKNMLEVQELVLGKSYGGTDEIRKQDDGERSCRHTPQS